MWWRWGWWEDDADDSHYDNDDDDDAIIHRGHPLISGNVAIALVRQSGDDDDDGDGDNDDADGVDDGDGATKLRGDNKWGDANVKYEICDEVMIR